MSDAEIVGQVAQLCTERKYEEAFALTDTIQNIAASIDAYLLCLEHEKRWKLDQEKTQ